MKSHGALPKRSGRRLAYLLGVMATLSRLAAGWYEGTFGLDRRHLRREPVAAGEYLRSVGLVDAFRWTAY